MARIAETGNIGTQDGARSGSRQLFLGVQVEVQKEVMLGPDKIDIGEAKSANKDPFWGVDVGAHFRSNLSPQNSPNVGDLQRLKSSQVKSQSRGVPAT